MAVLGADRGKAKDIQYVSDNGYTSTSVRNAGLKAASYVLATC